MRYAGRIRHLQHKGQGGDGSRGRHNGRHQHVRRLCWHIPYDDLGGAVDPTLQKVYIHVLPICTICKSQGAKSLVGRYRPNGQAIEKMRLDQKSKADAASAAVAGPEGEGEGCYRSTLDVPDPR